jgi:hypothetical protein
MYDCMRYDHKWALEASGFGGTRSRVLSPDYDVGNCSLPPRVFKSRPCPCARPPTPYSANMENHAYDHHIDRGWLHYIARRGEDEEREQAEAEVNGPGPSHGRDDRSGDGARKTRSVSSDTGRLFMTSQKGDQHYSVRRGSRLQRLRTFRSSSLLYGLRMKPRARGQPNTRAPRVRGRRQPSMPECWARSVHSSRALPETATMGTLYALNAPDSSSSRIRRVAPRPSRTGLRAQHEHAACRMATGRGRLTSQDPSGSGRIGPHLCAPVWRARRAGQRTPARPCTSRSRSREL